jgi:hypothetical protein
VIQDDTGRWVIKEEPVNWAALPVRVEAVIEQRLGRLDETLRDLLTVASVEGENFTAEVVARIQQMSAGYHRSRPPARMPLPVCPRSLPAVSV